MRTNMKDISLKKALKLFLVPKKGKELQKIFKKEDLEKGVSFPYYDPNHDAKIFKRKNGRKLYRISESIELLSKTKLKKLGLTEELISKKKPIRFIESNYSSKKYPVYKLTQFEDDLKKIEEEKLIKKHMIKTSKDLLLIAEENIKIHFVGTSSYPYKYNIREETIIHFETNNIILISIIKIPFKKSCIGKDEEHIINSFKELIYQTKKYLIAKSINDIKKKIILRIDIHETDDFIKKIEAAIIQKIDKMSISKN